MKTPEVDATEIVQIQTDEIVNQSAAGVLFMLVTVTCPCGWVRGFTLVYKCLYCNVWFCTTCAEEHFGKTISEYRTEAITTEFEVWLP